jgi:hypothetical protein
MCCLLNFDMMIIIIIIEFVDNNTESSVVHGFVHNGIMAGARHILDSYAMRAYISQLAELGYDIYTVGHSLGGGTAVLMAAELQSGFRNASSLLLRTARVRGVGFATPPVACVTLCDAMRQDGMCISVVNRYDAVPRFSRMNTRALAKDVKAHVDIADRWRRQDVAALQGYAASFGKAGEMKQAEEEVDRNTFSEGKSPKTSSANETSGEVRPASASAINSAKNSAVSAVAGIFVPSIRGKVQTNTDTNSNVVLSAKVVDSSTISASSSSSATVITGRVVAAKAVAPEEEIRLSVPGLILQLYKKDGMFIGLNFILCVCAYLIMYSYLFAICNACTLLSRIVLLLWI